jgi:delta-aminolevulinic acid dehydratase/porphobilinogen synthase
MNGKVFIADKREMNQQMFIKENETVKCSEIRREKIINPVFVVYKREMKKEVFTMEKKYRLNKCFIVHEKATMLLKGIVSRDFWPQFFSSNSSSWDPDSCTNNILLKKFFCAVI